jgi:exosome complex exonuclease RRP6
MSIKNEDKASLNNLISTLSTSLAASKCITVTDFDYFFSTCKEFSSLSRDCTKQIINLIKLVSSHIQSNHDFTKQLKKIGEKGAESIEDLFDSDSDLYESFKELIEKLFENTDLLIDEAQGNGAYLQLQKEIPGQINSPILTLPPSTSSHTTLINNTNNDIIKPQLKFLHEIDNSRDRPFRPRLKTKPYSQIPLNLTDKQYINVDSDCITPSTFYSNPYEFEYSSLTYPSWLLEDPTISIPFKPSPAQPFEYIDEEDDLLRVVDELIGIKELAVDLEHHSIRSFQGITCLMQMSSREKDYIIDVIALRSHMYLLSPIFANPDIVKVFHGCEHDILWLQRDFGIYVVNCFDTYHAAKLMSYPALSLSHLLKYHVGVTVNKKHQLSDWRIRPLDDEMIKYAKLDTHYLLYVFDCLRQGLWRHTRGSGDAILKVMDLSKQICQKRYEKDYFMPNGYQKLIENRIKKNDSKIIDLSTNRISELEEAVLSSLWNWRDMMARELDESVAYIMSNNDLLKISSVMPVEILQLETCDISSDVVKAYSENIIQLIKDQSQLGPSKLIINDIKDNNDNSLQLNNSKLKLNSFQSSTTKKNSTYNDLDTIFSFSPSMNLSSLKFEENKNIIKSSDIVLSWGKHGATTKPINEISSTKVSYSTIFINNFNQISNTNKKNSENMMQALKEIQSLSAISLWKTSSNSTNKCSSKNDSNSNDISNNTMEVIEQGNHFQSEKMHLESRKLIASSSQEKKSVVKEEEIDNINNEENPKSIAEKYDLSNRKYAPGGSNRGENWKKRKSDECNNETNDNFKYDYSNMKDGVGAMSGNSNSNESIINSGAMKKPTKLADKQKKNTKQIKSKNAETFNPYLQKPIVEENNSNKKIERITASGKFIGTNHFNKEVEKRDLNRSFIK